MSSEPVVFSGAKRADDFIEEEPTPAAVSAGIEAPRSDADDQDAPTVSAPTDTAPGVPAVAQSVDPASLVAAAMPSASRPASTTVTPRRAKKGARGVLARLGLPIAPGAAELAAIETAEQRAAGLEDARRVIRQATWTRAVAALIANPKGGTGKTPLAIALGGILAAIRGGDVCIAEVADDPGAIGYRAEGTPRLGVGEFVRDVADLTTKGQVTGYTAPQTSFAAVIGTVPGRPRPPLTYDAVTALAAKIDEHFEIRVMDSGNQPSSGAFQAAVDTADVLVVPVMNAGDSTLEALGMLAALRTTEAGRSLADRAIAVVMDDGRPQDARMTETVPEALAGAGVKTIHYLPYDEHLATRGEITLGNINQAATEALTVIGADVIRALTAAAVPKGRRASARTTTKEDD